MPLVTASQFQLQPNTGQAINSGLQLGRQIKQFSQQPRVEDLVQQSMGGDQDAFTQLASISPQRAQQVQQFQQQSLQQEQLLLDNRRKSVIDAAVQVQSIQDPKGKLAFLKKRKSQLQNKGLSTEDTDEAINLFESGDVKAGNEIIDRAVNFGVRTGMIKPLGGQQSSEGRSFESLIAKFSEEDKTKARRVKAGLDPRMVGSATQTIANLGTEADIADVEATIEGAKEVSKLKAQKKLKPEIESAVISAVGQAKAEVNKLGEERSNDKALGVYETAMGNLTKALDNTITGPFIGFTPAMTSNAQIADGAIAMMLPLMKDVFRGAGEGTFTEGDQKILTDLIPTRNDNAEARASKIKMLDSMIRAKLKTAPVAETQQSGLSEAEQLELQQLRAELGQ